jgi:hypothetical protein
MPPRPTCSDLLPPARPYLSKFPEPPKIVPPAGDLGFNISLCEAFHFQTIIVHVLGTWFPADGLLRGDWILRVLI